MPENRVSDTITHLILNTINGVDCQSVYMFDKVLASCSLFDTQKLAQKKCTSIDTHILEIDMYCDL
jgi:hypothetical protein